MALFTDRKTADDRTERAPEKMPFAVVAFPVFVFGACLACVLSVAIKAGRFVEYKIPLFLMEFPTGVACGVACVLFLAVLAGMALQKTLGDENSAKGILSRSQKISYFFSLLATLAFTAYVCAVAVHAIKTGRFLTECLYVVFLYVCVLSIHFKAGKSSLAHMFTTAAFILILIVTAFYGGIASAKTAGQSLTTVGGETFALVSARQNDFVLAGFDPRANRPNGRIFILPKNAELLERTVFYPHIEQKR